MDIILGAVFFIGGIILGAFLLVGYICSRMVGSDGWDDSNITNALRLLSHVTLHPEDFGKMYYPHESADGLLGERPFWYVDKDELSEVVKTRP
jgi:hypothetical protein